MKDIKTAEPTDWKTLLMPEEQTTIELDRRFSSEELEKIKRGVVPEEMEDKWFIYWKDDQLFFHRSWTGICLYVVLFTCDRDGASMISATVNRDPEQYKNQDDEYDAKMISFLIDMLLLRKPVPFPSKQDSKEKRALELFHLVGQAAFGSHPGDEREPRFQLKSRCFLCKHKYSGHKGCAAFPKGLPHALAIGDVMHDEGFPGDNGYRFEQSDNKRDAECDPTYNGTPIVIPVDKILDLAPGCYFKADPSDHLVYKNLVEFFDQMDAITTNDLVVASSFVYAWMPSCLEFKCFGLFDEIAAYLSAVRKGNLLDVRAFTIFKEVIDNSMIASSKLLHFANPEIYPIIDGHVGKFLKTHGQVVKPDDPAWYAAFTCAMRIAVQDERAGAIRRFVSDALENPASAIRALELVMFLTARTWSPTWKNDQRIVPPPSCPRCGAIDAIVSIVYGMPGTELFEAAERGEVRLGGCCIGDDNPQLSCTACGGEW